MIMRRLKNSVCAMSLVRLGGGPKSKLKGCLMGEVRQKMFDCRIKWSEDLP